MVHRLWQAAPCERGRQTERFGHNSVLNVCRDGNAIHWLGAEPVFIDVAKQTSGDVPQHFRRIFDRALFS